MKFTQPTLLLDTSKCLANLSAMVERAGKSRVRFRPHFKTHQSKTIGKWFYEAGVRHITVSSMTMAGYFAADGWKDITVAIPFNINEIEILNRCKDDVAMNILVSSAETAETLANRVQRKTGCYIKIDTGYGRCGFTPQEKDHISAVFSILQKNPLLEIKGLLSHFGHTYQARTPEEVSEIFTTGVHHLKMLKDSFSASFPDLEISVGDTPSCSLLSDFHDVTEIRPGNFIFYDSMQQQIGSCTAGQIAVGLVCPVIEVKPDINKAIIYGGAIHLSKDYITDGHGNKCYGAVCLFDGHSWSPPLEDSYVSSLSQEHGVLSIPKEISGTLKPGDQVVILPVHSCLTSSSMNEYYTLEGDHIKMMNKELR